MRFISAQFIEFLKDDLWIQLAMHANEMAKKLEEAVKPYVQLTQKVEANGVFAIIPHELIPKLQEKYFFYVWDEQKGEVRWMTSFLTTEDEINQFAEVVKEMIADYSK